MNKNFKAIELFLSNSMCVESIPPGLLYCHNKLCQFGISGIDSILFVC